MIRQMIRQVWLLSGADLRAAARAWELRGLLLSALVAGALSARPGADAWLRDRWESAQIRETEIPDTPEPLCRAGEGDARSVALIGEVPDWFAWYEPTVPEAEADVVILFSPAPPPDPGDRAVGLEILLFGQRPEAELNAVYRCIDRQRAAVRRARLDALGVTEAPDQVAEVRVLDAVQAAAAPALPIHDPAMFGFVALSALSWAYEALPGARQRGWLETLGTAAVPPIAVVAASALTGAVWALLNGLAFGIGSLISGVPPDLRWLSLPAVALTISALSVRAFVAVPDMRRSALRSSWIPLVIMALCGAALLMERGWGLGWLVPLGGLALPWLGVTPDPAGALAALVTSMLAAAVALHGSAGVLIRDGALAVGADPTGARRARGDWRPEAALLLLVAIMGLSVQLVPLGAGAAIRLFAGQACFLILPALVTPALLGLPARETLRLRLPPLRAWLAAPVVLCGTLSGGLLAMAIQARIFPENPFLMFDYSAEIETLLAGPGILVLTLGAGLSEELLFRGAILGLLSVDPIRGRGGWPALIGQAVAFALLHVLAFKLLPTGVIGLLLGLYAWRCGSIWPGVLAHAAHNAASLLLPQGAGSRWLEVFDVSGWPAWGGWVAALLYLTGCGAAWWSGRAPAADQRPIR